MESVQSGPAGPGGGPSDATTGRPRRHGRWRWHIAAPLIVGLAIAALIGVAAQEALQPTIEVDVRPVIAPPGAAVTTANAQDDRPRSADRGGDAGRHIRGRGQSVQAPGWLEAEPFVHACTALTDGVIDEMLVLAGDGVEQGQAVARLVSDDAELAIRAAEAELAEARADLEAAQADLAAAETDWENPVERERAVATSRAALAETQARLNQLPSLIAAEEATLERLREELARAREAQQRGATTDIEVIIQDRRTAAHAASLEALRRREGILQAERERLEAELAAAERQAELRVEERRALSLAKAAAARAEARAARLEARRDEAALRLERMTVRSPIDGYVQRRMRVPGDKVVLNTENLHSAHVAYVYNPDALQVRVDVPLADAAKVSVGQPCEVIVEILPERTFQGEVTRITHEADLQKNTLEVKVRVLDPSPLLKPEMLTRVKFLGGERRSDGEAHGPGSADGDAGPAPGTVRVAADCLEEPGRRDQARVWAVRDRRGDRGRVTPVDVRIETIDGDWATVQGDVRPGELLVAAPRGLAPGARVRMRSAAGATGGAT